MPVSGVASRGQHHSLRKPNANKGVLSGSNTFLLTVPGTSSVVHTWPCGPPVGKFPLGWSVSV